LDVAQLSRWRQSFKDLASEHSYLGEIVEAPSRGSHVYAVRAGDALAGAVVTNAAMTPPMLNLIWIHPTHRGGCVSVAATRLILAELLRNSPAAGVWKPSPRMRRILVELGMDERYDQPCQAIEFGRGELRLGP
jgi:hypothetical protein